MIQLLFWENALKTEEEIESSRSSDLSYFFFWCATSNGKRCIKQPHKTYFWPVLVMPDPQLVDKKAEYEKLPHDELVRRLLRLEQEVDSKRLTVSPEAAPKTEPSIRAKRAAALHGIPKAPSKSTRSFNVLSHPCRKIALRFGYDGEPYLGLAAQNGIDTLLPASPGKEPGTVKPDQVGPGTNSVEAVLWTALCQARLVDPAQGMEGAGFSRCGRTDRGVSAAGQVVSLWIRSKRVDEWGARLQERREWLRSSKAPEEGDPILHRAPLTGKDGTLLEFQPASEELPYVHALNRILPSTIQITGWSPVRADFSSRFDCRYRHYKYFFTSGAPPVLRSLKGNSSVPGLHNAGSPLDIAAMRDAAARFLGEHDFRNVCKLVPDKQITNFRRRVDGISIDLVDHGWPLRPIPAEDTALDSHAPAYTPDNSAGPPTGEETTWERMFVLNLRGTAFLYHQVRHMVAVLFMVGAGLEQPSVVDELLNVRTGAVAADRLGMRLAGLRAGPDAPSANHHHAVVLDGATGTSMAGKTAADEDRALAANVHREAEAAVAAAHAPPSSSEEKENNKNRKGAPVAAASDKLVRAQAHEPILDQLYASLSVIEGRPSYEMASDAPLMLWECGFKPSDVQWRAGSYDGPLFEPEMFNVDEHIGPESDWPRVIASTKQHQSQEEHGDMAVSSLSTGLHASWVRMAIKTQLYRHFVLSAPTPSSGGWFPASSLYHHARRPTLIPPPAPDATSNQRILLPMGYATSRSGQPGWTPVARLKRDEPPEVRNERFRTEKAWKMERRAQKVEAKRNHHTQNPCQDQSQR